MLESVQNNTFEYEKLSPEEMQKRGILGRLKGVIADYKNPTRNGRRYGKELWERLFDDPITKEKIANRCMFGEIEHPTDGRTEIDPQKIAICLAEQPKLDDKGHLMGVFDILPTPCGQILKTLLDYGTTIGVSSRGTGDTFIGDDGVEEVDPYSYECTGWDAVITPAVKEARMQFVTESAGNKTLKMALAESLKSADEKDRKIMQETLNDLGINISESVNTANPPEKGVSINATIESDNADNDGNSLVEELQTALLKVQELQDKVGSLQEKLSVCYAKELDYKEEAENYKRTISKLTESVKSIEPLKKRVSVLSEELDSKKTLAESSQAELGEKNEKVRGLSRQNRSLKENLEDKERLIESLKEQIQSKDREMSVFTRKYEDKIERLNEELSETKKDSDMLYKDYLGKLDKQTALVEKYKKIAKVSVNRYMESQANKLGVSVNEIRSKLNESYTFDDIDKVCDEIQDVRLGLNSLPFSVNFNNKTKMRVNESIDTTIPLNEDDIVDDTLRSIVNSSN